ncbi:hypothetical protein QUB33_00410 [Microcoleus sp. B3-A4]
MLKRAIALTTKSAIAFPMSNLRGRSPFFSESAIGLFVRKDDRPSHVKSQRAIAIP